MKTFIIFIAIAMIFGWGWGFFFLAAPVIIHVLLALGVVLFGYSLFSRDKSTN